MNDIEKIKTLRNQLGISQTKMAKEIGLSQPGYANLENGVTENISLTVAIKISKVLGVGFNELYDIDGDSKKIEGLQSKISRLNNRIIELEEQLADKKIIIEFLSRSDFLLNIVGAILHKKNMLELEENFKFDVERIKDFNNMISVIEEIDSHPLDPGVRKSMEDFIGRNLDLLKK